MLNRPIPKEKLKKLKLLVLDSDGVSLPRGTDILQKEDSNFYQASIKTLKVSDKMADMLKALKKKIKVGFSSGRGLIYLQAMYGKVLGGGTFLQAENGNLSLINGKIVQHFSYTEDYFQKIGLIRSEIAKLPIKGFEPKHFILTVHALEEFPEVYDILKKYDPEQELQCMWNGEAFDIQKKNISKGAGLRAIIKYLNLEPENVIAIGDRVNDKELLEIAGIGVSADQRALPAEYYTKGDQLGGEVLVEYLLNNL